MATNFPHTISWFEIPVTDIARATNFYEKMFDITLEKQEMGEDKMAIFPAFGPTESEDSNTVHGALVQSSQGHPSKTGTLIYFNGGDDLSAALSRVEMAGGKVTKPKSSIGNYGHYAVFEDTEGNTLAIHSKN